MYSYKSRFHVAVKASKRRIVIEPDKNLASCYRRYRLDPTCSLSQRGSTGSHRNGDHIYHKCGTFSSLGGYFSTFTRNQDKNKYQLSYYIDN